MIDGKAVKRARQAAPLAPSVANFHRKLAYGVTAAARHQTITALSFREHIHYYAQADRLLV
jgi:hypothetical protein